MIDGWAVLLWVLAIGTAWNSIRLLGVWTALTNADPLELCDACRIERRRVMEDASRWEAIAPVGPALHVMYAGAAWWVTPFENRIRRAAGKEPIAKCSGTGAACVRRRAGGRS